MKSIWHKLQQPPDPPPPMPVVVGSPRSGTTLLRLMLDTHPMLAIPPETGFIPAVQQLNAGPARLREAFFQQVTSFPPDAPAWNDFQLSAEAFQRALADLRPFSVAEGCRLFYKMYAARFAKPRWGDKTPLYCRSMAQIEQLLPEAHFIHILRDGRDAAASLRGYWFSPGADMVTQAAYWRENVLAAHAQGSRCSHYLEVFFEDLVREPEPALRRICAFIKLDFHADMLRYDRRALQRLAEHGERRRVDGSLLVSQEARYAQQSAVCRPLDASKIGSWRMALRPDEIRAFEQVAGDALRLFGYPLN